MKVKRLKIQEKINILKNLVYNRKQQIEKYHSEHDIKQVFDGLKNVDIYYRDCYSLITTDISAYINQNDYQAELKFFKKIIRECDNYSKEEDGKLFSYKNGMYVNINTDHPLLNLDVYEGQRTPTKKRVLIKDRPKHIQSTDEKEIEYTIHMKLKDYDIIKHKQYDYYGIIDKENNIILKPSVTFTELMTKFNYYLSVGIMNNL